MITDKSSRQYDLQQKANTNEDGLRVIDNKLMIAIANYHPGDELLVELDSGQVIETIVGDVKANTACLHNDNSLIEFIVDTRVLSPQVMLMGSLDSIYEGNIVRLYIKEQEGSK